MSLSASDLDSFVASVHERSAGIDSQRAVELRVVEPFLECLGWDVRGPSVDPQAEVGGVRVAYLLSVDGDPSIAVQTAAPGAELESESVPAVGDVLDRTTLDWGIVTDGQRYVLLAHSDDGVHRRRHRLDALPDALDALQHYTHEAAVRRRESERTDRVAALCHLEERRGEAIDAVTASLVSIAGDVIEDPARSAASGLVDDLLEELPSDSAAPDDSIDATASAVGARDGTSHPTEQDQAGAPERPRSDASGRARDSSRSPAGSGSHSSSQPADSAPPAESAHGATGTQTTGSQASNSGGASRDESRSAANTADSHEETPLPPTARTDGDGEYVVRFFGGNASVGAVGTDNPPGTLVGAVRFLLENQELASSVTLPWGVEGDRAVLASTPEHPDGSAMTYYDSIEEEWYVWTGGDEARIRAAIEDLADAVGLRVMFQGDW